MTSSASDPDPPSLNPRIYTTAQLEQLAEERNLSPILHSFVIHNVAIYGDIR